MAKTKFNAKTAAEALLVRLKQLGVDYFFGNAGTDFPPIIEALANGTLHGADMPETIPVLHENVAIGMAHGYYFATGKPQALMFHVNVGLANATMGVINAASSNVPMLVMAGRTPLSEHGRLGSRSTPIHWGQEMFDQSALVRESTKWDYELRYGEQIVDVIDRAYAISMSEPRGPVYLGLPREPLSEPWKGEHLQKRPKQNPIRPTLADPDAIEEVAELLAHAKHPLVITQKGDTAGKLAGALGDFVEQHALPVVEFWPIRNILRTDHPMHGGYNIVPWIEEADVILTIDTRVPWIESQKRPNGNCRVIQAGADPLFTQLPVRTFQTDLALGGTPIEIVKNLHAAMDRIGIDNGRRYAELTKQCEMLRQTAWQAAGKGADSPMSAGYVSKCISDALGEDGAVVTEMGVKPDTMLLQGANRLLSHPLSGGLGWGFPAALGVSLANRDRLVIACVGDGAYTFANPVACHQVAEALNLPLLTIVLNNGIWNAVRRATTGMYPQGEAVKMNTMPLTALEPSPNYRLIAEASRAWTRHVEHGKDLPAALKQALEVIKTERRQVLLEVMVGI